ncbi:hypothetical protein PQX77_006425 [Marasmius sp. AFHP31]|nr:hypothetical protein PQX77_006425 [Marasmius sp. AFHP31]
MAPASTRFSVRAALKRLKLPFSLSVNLSQKGDLTVSAPALNIEELASLCHNHDTEELQNADPDIEVLAALIELEESPVETEESQQRQRGKKRAAPVDVQRAQSAANLSKKQKGQDPVTTLPATPGPKSGGGSKTPAGIQPPAARWSLDALSELEPGKIPTPREDFSGVPKGLSRKEKRTARDAVRRRARNEAKFGREIATPSVGLQDIALDSRISSTGWQGLNVTADVREEIRRLVQSGGKIKHLQIIPYSGKRTLIADGQGRVFLAQSEVSHWMVHEFLPLVNNTAARFMKEVVWPSEEEMQENLRGLHFFCIAGYDRNNKSVSPPFSPGKPQPHPANGPPFKKPALSRWHTLNAKALASFFEKGQPLEILTGYGCQFLQSSFPDVVKRYKRCADDMEKRYGIWPPYGGLFWNFCLNGARSNNPKVPRVFCDPHIDFKNLALAVFMVFVYGHFNHREKCWIVIWEAGIALELPMGVFVLYPSSLFLHFNVDIANLEIVVTKDGRRPTKDNSQPLDCLCGKRAMEHDQDWQESKGRGSMVWFNQATMFQTTELGFDTVQQARDAGAQTTCQTDKWLQNNIFPKVSLD